MAYKNKEYFKQYRQENKEKIKEQCKKYYQENEEKIKEYQKEWWQKNKECRKEYMKEYNKQWNIDNNEYHKQYQKQRRKTDLKYNLNGRMSYAIRKSLKSNKAGRHWEDLVGYTVKDLEEHLQKKMPPHYTWQDYLDGKLHIDHIIPKSVFNFTKYTQIDFRKCWALKNLQLLPAEENLIKGAKLKQPFQPALKMAI